MNLDEVIFIDRFPKLDLHGYDRMTASVATNDFIMDCIKMKESIAVIIHGIGKDIVRESVHDALRKNRNVISYKIFAFNVGCTIVQIRVDK